MKKISKSIQIKMIDYSKLKKVYYFYLWFANETTSLKSCEKELRSRNL